MKRKISIKKILTKLHKKGSEYITIMIVPRNKNNIQNFQTSYYFLGGSLILLLILFVLNIFILLHKSTINETFIATRQQYKSLEKEKRSMIKQIKNLKANIKKTDMLISDMLLITNPHEGRVDLSAVGGGIDKTIVSDEENSDIYISPNTLALRDLNQKMQTSKEAISEIDNYLKANEKIFSHLPTSWPIKGGGGYVTSPYGWRSNPVNKKKKEFHKGLDIAFYPGSPIVATADGVVISAGMHSSYGNMVTIRHKFGFITKYAHCKSLTVHTGQRVKRGQVIAYMGKSGRTTGYHLHYEIRIGSQTIDPLPFILKIKE